MALTRSFMASTALGLSLFTTSAAADLTATQVWDDWRTYLEGVGYTVTATQTTTGATLSVNDIVMTMSGAGDAPSVVMRIGGLEFVENGDGSVNVVMPERMPLALEITPDDDAAAEITLEYVQTGHQMTVRGDAAALAYDYSAETFGLSLASLIVDGATMEDDTARFALTGSALQSKTNVAVGELRTYDQSVQMGAMSYDLMFREPDGVEAFGMKSTVNAPTFAGTMTLPTGDAPLSSDLGPLVAAGFAVDGNFAAQGAETESEITSAEGTSRLKTATTSSSFNVAVGQTGLRYQANAQGIQMGGQMAGLPFPLFVEVASNGFDFQSPLVQADTPQDFKLALNITDFTMSDIIWALFDAAGQLPRDPVTIAMDLSGKANVLFDPLDPQSMQQFRDTGQAPVDLDTVRIDQLLLDALGAKIEAMGAVRFEDTGSAPASGAIGTPVGDININIAGANGLMDKLVAMGLLPAEQVIGARLMMGIFAVPGDTPDTLTSKIEFNEDGRILANGQQIR